jgi:hypothetical protein
MVLFMRLCIRYTWTEIPPCAGLNQSSIPGSVFYFSVDFFIYFSSSMKVLSSTFISLYQLFEDFMRFDPVSRMRKSKIIYPGGCSLKYPSFEMMPICQKYRKHSKV